MPLSKLPYLLPIAGLLTIPQAAQAEQKVLIIGIDGCRGDALLEAATPNLDSLWEGGAYSWQARTSFPSSSGPGWSSMLTATWPDKHHVLGNDFRAPNFDAFPHFFTRLEEVEPEAFTVSVVHWSPINTEILDTADVVRTGLSDADVAFETAELLAEADPDVVFVHFDDVDGAGHGHGFSPYVAEYLRAIEVVDEHIGRLLDSVQSRPTYEDEEWLIMVSSDHGGLLTGHGGPSDREMNSFLIINSPRSIPGPIEGPSFVVDVPATAFDFLDLEVDPEWRWDGASVGLL